MNRVVKLSTSCAFVLLLLSLSAPVLAHANLVRSEPAATSAQKVPPTQVRLWFSEDVEPRFSSVSVLDKSSAAVDKGDAHRMSDDAKGMEVSLNALNQGLYTVAWKATSAVDGHVSAGSFAFTVGDAPLTDASPRELMSQVDAALSADAAPPLYEVVVRWLNVLLLALLVGALTFPVLILFPALGSQDAQIARWLGATRLLWVLGMLASVGMLAAEALTVGGLDAIGQVVLGTRFGTIWIARVVLLAVVGHLLFRMRWQSPRIFGGAAVLGVLLLATQSLTSHDAAVANPPVLPFVTDWVHLLGVAVWIGGLVQLLVLRKQVTGLAALVARFSLVAFSMVAVVVLTGAYSMYLQVGSLEALFETLYGTALVVKLLLIVPLLALGALNLIVTRPTAARATANALERLTRGFNVAVALEVAFAAGVFLAVGVMTSVQPAQSAYQPSSNLHIETRRAEDVLVTLGVAPALVGTNDFDIKLRDPGGQPIPNATVVRLLASVREMDMGTQEIAATNQGNGHYTLHGDVMSMVGTWQLQVLVRRQGVNDVRTNFTVFAAGQPAPAQPSVLLTSTRAQLGLGLALFALAYGTASALLLHKRTGRVVSLGGAIAVALIGVYGVLQTSAAPPTPQTVVLPVVPGLARVVRPPIPPDATQIAAGREIYIQNCATCHGTAGKGDGPAAATLNPRPFDLTVHAPLHTEGELYYWVTNGITGTAMPAWQDRLSDLQRWQAVLFVKTLGTGTPTSAGGGTPAAVAQSAPMSMPMPAGAEGVLLVSNPAPELRLALTIAPDVTNAGSYDVQVTGANQQPIPDMERVALEFAWLESDSESQTVTCSAGGDGHYRATGNYTPEPGLWRIRVSAQRGGNVWSAEFPVLHEYTPNPENEPQGVVLLRRANVNMNMLMSLRAVEDLNDGMNGNVKSLWEYQWPDRLRYRVVGGLESVAVGMTQYYLEKGAWNSRTRVDAFKFPYFDMVRQAESIHLGRTEEIDKMPVQVVTLVLAAGDEPLYYAYWIGLDDFLLYQYALVTPMHYMMHVYSDYNGPIEISAPVGK